MVVDAVSINPDQEVAIGCAASSLQNNLLKHGAAETEDAVEIADLPKKRRIRLGPCRWD